MTYNQIKAFARTLRKNQTEAEAIVWAAVRNRNFYGFKFTRQFVIQHADIVGKKYFFIADFHCSEHRLIVEIDGDVHEEQLEYDEIRTEILEEMGFRVVRFSNYDVKYDWDSVERRLKGILGVG
ncbi:MAG: endonuclease domain-containing protein [Saprospiraceae bacterium]